MKKPKPTGKPITTSETGAVQPYVVYALELVAYPLVEASSPEEALAIARIDFDHAIAVPRPVAPHFRQFFRKLRPGIVQSWARILRGDQPPEAAPTMPSEVSLDPLPETEQV